MATIFDRIERYAVFLLIAAGAVLFMNTMGGNQLPTIFGSLVLYFLGLLSAVIVTKMLNNTIDLTHVISEDNGHASLSRFQFLLFTFVIAGSYLLMVLATLAKDVTLNLPSIPPGVLGLIGISGGSYVLAKGIQKSAESAESGKRVSMVTMTANGAGYDIATKVALSGGGGSGATASVAVDSTTGAITAVRVDTPGTGYTSAPTLAFVDPTGKGSGATAIAGLV